MKSSEYSHNQLSKDKYGDWESNKIKHYRILGKINLEKYEIFTKNIKLSQKIMEFIQIFIDSKTSNNAT